MTVKSRVAKRPLVKKHYKLLRLDLPGNEVTREGVKKHNGTKKKTIGKKEGRQY